MTSKQFTQDFESAIRFFNESDKIDKSLDFILKSLDDALLDKEYYMIDGFLDIVDLEILGVEQLISVLYVCHHYGKHLSNYNRVRSHLIDTVNANYNTEEAKQILNGI